MHGIYPTGYLKTAAERLDDLTEVAEIETVLDEVEYLFELIPPERQKPAKQLIERLRVKLGQARR